jgi:restriction system protein
MIPDYQTLMLPVLRTAENVEIHTRESINRLAEFFELSDEEREQRLSSGKQRTFDNRVHWAKFYLKQAGLLTYPKRGYFVATEEGRKVLEQNPGRIDNEYLYKFDAFREFRPRRNIAADDPAQTEQSIVRNDATPDEILRAAYRQINSTLKAELLERVRLSSPTFFENLIITLLLEMGYGGASEEAARAIGRSGDDGVDGVIDQDPLGVDQIYIQAKRYGAGKNISAGDVRDFFGALNLKKTQKGIFFTTSSFSPNAAKTAKDLGTRIVLIDGERLTGLMIQYGIGCRTEDTVHLKKIDDEFFEEV